MHLESFYTYLQFERRYSRHTLDAYRNDLEAFGAFIRAEYGEGDPDLIDVHHRQVRAWIIALMESGVAARSVNRKISALKTYYRFCMQQKVIRKNPMTRITAPKTPKNLPLFVERSGMQELFSLVEKDYPVETEQQRFVQLRDSVIVEVLYATGMRRGELLGLTDLSIDRSNRQVKVLGKGNKERIIPVSEALIELVDRYIAERKRLFGSGTAFLVTASGKPAYPRMVYTVVHRVLQKVTTLTRTSPHVLRHTFATHLSNNGAELNAVKELLGHASLASTQVYTHNSIDQLKKIHKRSHPKG